MNLVLVYINQLEYYLPQSLLKHSGIISMAMLIVAMLVLKIALITAQLQCPETSNYCPGYTSLRTGEFATVYLCMGCRGPLAKN